MSALVQYDTDLSVVIGGCFFSPLSGVKMAGSPL